MNSSNNIIIAEFIGMQKTDLGWFDAEEVLNLPNNKDNTFDVLMFDKDWNWLISVVGYITTIEEDIYETKLSYEINDAIINNSITMGVNAVLEYIQTR